MDQPPKNLKALTQERSLDTTTVLLSFSVPQTIPKPYRLGDQLGESALEAIADTAFRFGVLGLFLAGNRRLVAILLGLRETEEQRG